MIVYKIPHKLPPYLDEIDGTLESLQECVGGYIEVCTPAELEQWNICLLANEEGLLKGLEPNENLYPFFFAGDLVAVGTMGDEFFSLTAGQVQIINEFLKKLNR